MPERKRLGDLAEVILAGDLLRQGYKIAIPFGEDWDYDLIVLRNTRLERVQAKYVASDGNVVPVKCFSASLTAGRVRAIKRYTAETVDWIGVFDATTDRCYYVHSREFPRGRSLIHLRLVAPRNNQQERIRWARDYLSL